MVIGELPRVETPGRPEGAGQENLPCLAEDEKGGKHCGTG